MKNNPLAVLLIGLAAVGLCGVGGVVGLGVLAGYFAAQMRPAAPALSTIPVVVAAVDLPADTVLDDPEKQLLLRPHLPDTVPPGFFSNMEDLRGKVIRRTIDRGAPVLSRDAGTPVVQLEPGMRAFAIRTGLEQTAGFITPGKRIDILGTVAEPNDGGKSPVKVVAQNVLVLAVDVDVQNAGKGVLVTVALPADAVAAVTQAEKLGPLQIVLRQPKAAAPEKLEPGMRAVTIRRTGELFGTLQPGCRVDVSATLVHPDDSERMRTKTVARDVLVLALNTRSGGDDGRVPTVTLAVRQEDVAKFVEANSEGKINITVRPPALPD